MAAHRDLTPLMRKVRDFVSFRKIKNPVRFPSQVSARSIPAPNLPDGPSGALSANFYCQRDARRFCDPPATVYVAGQKVLPPAAEGGDVAKIDTSSLKKVPGFGFDYGSGRGMYSR